MTTEKTNYFNKNIIKFFDGLKLTNYGIKNMRFTALLVKSLNAHKEIHKEYYKKIKIYLDDNLIEDTHTNLNNIEYFEKNFFSIFMLSILKKLDIKNSRVFHYGMIIQSIRGIVTAADNIIDNENKSKFRIPNVKNIVLNNSLLSIIHQNIMEESLDYLSDSSSEKILYRRKLLDCFMSIAKGESIREYDKSYKNPEWVIENIHKKIGGELLEFAFAIPTIRENLNILSDVKLGIKKIGIALQMLDDVTDLLEDYENNKINLMFMEMIKENSFTIDELSSKLNIGFMEDPIYKKSQYKISVDAIDLALDGFEIIGKTGYPINRKEGLSIIKIIFKLRGVSTKIFEKYNFIS